MLIIVMISGALILIYFKMSKINITWTHDRSTKNTSRKSKFLVFFHLRCCALRLIYILVQSAHKNIGCFQQGGDIKICFEAN